MPFFIAVVTVYIIVNVLFNDIKIKFYILNFFFLLVIFYGLELSLLQPFLFTIGTDPLFSILLSFLTKNEESKKTCNTNCVAGLYK